MPERIKIHTSKINSQSFSKFTSFRFIDSASYDKHEGGKYFVVPKIRTKSWIGKNNNTVKKTRIMNQN